MSLSILYSRDEFDCNGTGATTGYSTNEAIVDPFKHMYDTTIKFQTSNETSLH